MRSILAAVTLVCFGFGAQASRLHTDLQTVSFVELSKYAGRWYQIARNPLKFEPLECACAQQTLLPAENGKISVYNSCNVDGPAGVLSGIKGFATAMDATNSKFEVDLNVGKLGYYWIIGLAEDYRWAVVSDPTRESLYVLSKTPEIQPADYIQALTSVVISNAVDLSKLRPTNQVGCTYPALN